MRTIAICLFLCLTVPAAAQEPPPAPAQAADVADVTPPELIRFEEARLPADAGVAPGRYAVNLRIVVGEDGQVGEVRVESSDAPALEPLAVEAAKRFAFRPATVSGPDGPVPVAVEVGYRYEFDVRPRERVVAFVFTVRERGTRDLLDGVTGVLEENGRPFTSVQGRVEVSDLEPGRYTFYVPAGEFDEVRAPFAVEAGKVGSAEIRLERRSEAARQTVIRAPKEARLVARQTLQATELRRLPGSAGDPLKMVENLPGMARSQFGSGQVVVYGSPPLDSQVLVERMNLGNLYHFGGIYSVINPEFIERIDFVPAGFDATYGNATGGIVDVKLKEEPLTGLHGAADVNVLHAGALLGIPYSKDGDIQVAFRRSYIDAILAALPAGEMDITTAPRYYDYQLRLQHRFGERHRLTVFVNGTDDAMRMVSDRPQGNDAMMVGDTAFSSWSHSAIVRWTADPTAAIRNTLTVQGLLLGFDMKIQQAMRFKLRDYPVKVDEQLDWRISSKVRLRVGLQATAEFGTFSARSPQPPQDGQADYPMSAMDMIETDQSFRLFSISPFASLEWQPLPWWTIVPSVRADVFMGAWNAGWVDPRLSMRFRLHESVTLKAAGGLYQQIPPPWAFMKDYGNPDIGPQGAAHALLGVEWTPHDRVTLTANGFYKHLFHQAEPSRDLTVRYTDTGRGRAYGGDFMLRVNPGGPLVGWIAYTYVVSERWDERLGAYRPSNQDQRHLLNVLASYELPRRWTLGARFRLASGYPYTPVVGSVFDSDADRYVGRSGPANSGRVPLFHSLDVRVDKQWVFDAWKLGVYVEVQNVYNRRSAEGVQYSYDYSQSAWVPGLPVLPVFGVKGEF